MYKLVTVNSVGHALPLIFLWAPGSYATKQTSFAPVWYIQAYQDYDYIVHLQPCLLHVATVVTMLLNTRTSNTVTMETSHNITMATIPPITSTTGTTQPSTMVTTPPPVTIATNLIIIVVPVVLVLVVCLLVVCAIATIIILYQRAKRHHNHQQDTTKYELTQPAAATVNTLPNPIYNTLTEGETPAADYSDKETPAKGGTIQVAKNPAYFVYSTIADAKEATSEYSVVTETTKQPATPHDDGQYNPTHHEHTDPPPTYSTLAEEGVPADYQTIADNPAYKRTVTEGGAPADYSVITETQDTSDGGMVYSAVVRKDGKKTTVKTTPQDGVLDDSQQQPASDTSNEELVYSAVVVKDGKKTTVKTTAQNVVFDDSQQQPASDTSNEGLVYSAVVVKDGKKTTVKTMATTQNEDNEQTSSTSDTVQPAEGMVYSAVIRQDGKKTSVKVTVEWTNSPSTSLGLYCLVMYVYLLTIADTHSHPFLHIMWLVHSDKIYVFRVS